MNRLLDKHTHNMIVVSCHVCMYVSIDKTHDVIRKEETNEPSNVATFEC